jgi:bacterial/archaeal transporter family protein
MERWVVYALLSMVFAGLTGVLAKQGLSDISSELALVVRTVFVFGLVLAFGMFVVPRAELGQLTGKHCLWLGLSAVATAASWVFYYKALQQGEVSTVALIDKGSFLVAVLLAWLILGETLTLRHGVAAMFILVGLLIAAKRS